MILWVTETISSAPPLKLNFNIQMFIPFVLNGLYVFVLMMFNFQIETLKIEIMYKVIKKNVYMNSLVSIA